MPQQITKPRIIAFEVTRRCRLNCQHCRACADIDAKTELDTNQCKNILKAIADYNRCVVVLTGGEPTERDDIYELIEFGNNLGLRMAMATCGYSITDESIAKLKNAGILTLSFSLDGKDSQTHDSFRQSPGAFDITMAAIEKTRKADIRFQINTTITKANFDQIDAIAKIAEHSGAYCFNPFILVPTGRGEQIADTILEPNQYEQILSKLAELKNNNPIEIRVTCGPQFVRVYHKLNPDTKVHGCLPAAILHLSVIKAMFKPAASCQYLPAI
jgi:AdoMet-dependent heme synthase